MTDKIQKFLEHFLLHLIIAAASTLISLIRFNLLDSVIIGAFVSFSCACYSEGYDEWMVYKGKYGHNEGWDWKDWFQRNTGALIILGVYYVIQWTVN